MFKKGLFSVGQFNMDFIGTVVNTTFSHYRTKALVLELLAAVCLVSGGHEIILSAFDNFKEVSQCSHDHHINVGNFSSKPLLSKKKDFYCVIIVL